LNDVTAFFAPLRSSPTVTACEQAVAHGFETALTNWIDIADIDHVDFCGAVTLLGSSKIKETGSLERIDKDKGESRLGL
jgi:hypothetical protein